MQETNIEFKEIHKQPKVLEIGVGAKPYYEIFGESKPEGFVGVDIRHPTLQVLKQSNPDLDLAITNARLLPFENEVFDNVVLNSVIGGPDEGWYYNKLRKADLTEKEFLNRKYDIVQEAFRVLKPGGRLKIFELYTMVGELEFLEIIDWLMKQKTLLKQVKVEADEDFYAFIKSRKERGQLGIVFEKM